ncbi:MAG: Scr1 family TA system antitoxin-like transcriptional regulator [Dehalococcoidia bacterium]
MPHLGPIDGFVQPAPAVNHAALAARIEHQGVLHDSGEREFEFLIAQRLLTWAPTPGVLGPQLAQLTAVAQLPHVQLAVLPDSHAGALAWHNFVVRHPADGGPAYVAAELIDGAHDVHDSDSVAVYLRVWSRMWDAAVRGDEALALIRAVAD